MAPTRRHARFVQFLRVAFVLFHLHAVCVLALPSPGPGMRRATWRDPTVQGEFRTWARTLQGLGLSVTPAGLEDWAFRTALDWVDVQRRLSVLAAPYADLVGVRQPWRMFVAPHRFPSRLQLEVDEGEGFRPVYVARDPTHTYQARLLDHDRMRAAIFRYGWPSYDAAYHRFVEALARRAAADMPRMRRLRARFFKYRTPRPEEVLAGSPPRGRFVRTVTVPRPSTAPPAGRAP